ncbi:hypothetical protein SAMN02910292_02525 [Lachnospiraceae bacterium XBB2008]|nr:hypothetical protein SAMN02910292_02525 [Lachnospiraceae bacterium XBB2008]
MAKHIGNKIVRFTGVTDLDDTPLSDWRGDYLGLPGMLCIYESEHKVPGKRLVYFFPHEPDKEMQRYMHTTFGDYSESDGIITLTSHHIYKFEIGDFLSEDEHKILWLNAFLI